MGKAPPSFLIKIKIEPTKSTPVRGGESNFPAPPPAVSVEQHLGVEVSDFVPILHITSITLIKKQLPTSSGGSECLQRVGGGDLEQTPERLQGLPSPKCHVLPEVTLTALGGILLLWLH